MVPSGYAGLKTLIFPAENRKDYDDLPDYLREGIAVYFVKTYSDVYRIAFTNGQGKSA